MEPKVPSRIDRATFDRVLQRAAELQAAARDIGDGLSEEEILALGTEVGIPAQHLRQALIEERTRAIEPVPHGLVDRWLAPTDLVTQRVVQGTPESVGSALTRWMEHQEHFVVQRTTPNRITFEPMEPFAGAMRRIASMFDPTRGKPYLAKAELLTAVITPLEAGFCHIALAASLRRTRSAMILGGSGLAFGGMAAGGFMMLIGAPMIIGGIVLVPAAIGGWAIARAFRGRAHRAALGLERALDELERRPALPADRPVAGKPNGLARGVGQVVREITHEVRKALDE